MRIESIEIQNFRQYQHAELKFPRNPKAGDIHIILGENGEGKTNILNAITWCLYGEETHLGDKNTALPLINSHYIKDCRSKGEDYGHVKVQITISTEDGAIIFIRTATFSLYSEEPFKTEEKLAVFDSKGNYIDNDDYTAEYVYRYLPQEINDYIFFDGEHLDDYFKSGKRSQIESGIKDLTQASIVKRTIDAFNRYLKQEINSVLENADDSKVKTAQRKVEESKKRVENSKNTIEELSTQKRESTAKIEELNEIIKGHENLKEKALKMEELEGNLNEFRAQQDDQNAKLMQFTREYFVYLSLYPKMKSFYDYIKKLEKSGNLPPKVDKLLVKTILETKKCPICGSEDLDDAHIKFVEGILKRLEVSTQTSNCLNKAMTALEEYFKKITEYPDKKNGHKTTLLFIDNQIKRLEAEYKELSDAMKRVADSEKITRAINDCETWKSVLEDIIKKQGIEQHLLEQNQQQLEIAQKELDAVLRKNQAYATLRKQKDFCEESIKVLERTMTEVLEECRKELEVNTFEKFDRLMWKKDTFKKVEIDKDYVFHLLNNFDQETLGSCSAAERGLLALSFTMALQEISRHDSLLYIDTPLGRVGNKNRINFAEILKSIAQNKQVILSFTPSEYDPNVQSILAGNYSTFQDLVYNNGITTIKVHK